MLLSSWESHHISTPQLPGASVAWTEQAVAKLNPKCICRDCFETSIDPSGIREKGWNWTLSNPRHFGGRWEPQHYCTQLLRSNAAAANWWQRFRFCAPAVPTSSLPGRLPCLELWSPQRTFGCFYAGCFLLLPLFATLCCSPWLSAVTQWNFPELMEMLCVCTAQYGSHKPREAELLKKWICNSI